MDLQTLKKYIEVSDFPKETADAINNILGMAVARNGELSDEEAQEILNLIDDAAIKNEKETKQLVDVVEAVEGIQDEYIDSVDAAYEVQEEEKSQLKNDSSTADDSAGTPPATNPPSNPTV